MTDGPQRPIELWCPSCHTTVADATACPACGFPGQQTLEAARLRVVVARMAEIGAQHAALAHETDMLVEERHRLFTMLRGVGPVDPPTFPPAAGAEWRPERVRDALLWLGALLLVIAAITFAAVAWARVGPGGRAGILFGVTVGSGALTAFVRRRLRPTAEALAAITIALALVDWGVARRTGLRGDLSDAAWWTIGLTLVAVACAALADRADLTAVRIGTVTLLPAAAVAGLVAVDPSDSLGVVALALITGAVTAGRARARGRWTDVRGWLTFLAVAGEIVVAAAALALAVDRWAEVGRAGAALAVLSVAFAPLASLVVRDRDDRADTAVASGVITLATLGAGAVLLSGSRSDSWVLAAVAAGALLAGILARALPARPRLGVVAAAATALVPPTVAVGPNVAAAWLHPAAWLAAPWTGSLADPVGRRVAHGLPADIHGLAPSLVTLACLALFLLVVPTDAGTRVLRLAGAGIVAALAGTIALAGAVPSIGAALALHLAATILLVLGAIVADRRASAGTLPLLAVALVAALPAVGFAAVSPSASLFTLVVALGLGSVAAVSFRTPALRLAAAAGAGAALIGATAVVLGDRGTAVGVAGVVIVTVGAAVLVAARLVPWREPTRGIGAGLEAVGAAGVAIGLAVAGDRPTWRLLGFAIGTGALLLAACRADDRAPGYAWAALVAGGLGGVAGLVTGRIPSEWITVPAGAAAVAIGLAARFPVRRSWLRLGPGLLLAFVTSVGLAVDRGSVPRALVVGVAALVVLALGARSRLGAPIVVGSVALLVLAIDGIAPYAASVPRWLLIGTAGALALWAGATADRRLDQLRRWRSAIDRLA